MTALRKSMLRLIVVGAAAAAGVSAARADVFSNVPEASGYSLVYTLPIPDIQYTTNAGGYNTSAVPYSVNNSANFPAGSFDRVAYYLELSGSTDATRPNGYVYASFDAPAVFTDASKIGVPSNGPNGSKVVTNTAVANMNVFSNVAGVTTGTSLTGGKLEFWPSNYGGGPDNTFNYDDDGFGPGSGHGSMQVHNVNAQQTLIGYSDWGGNNPNEPSEIGIGNNPGAGAPDWTFSNSGTTYTVRNLQILVHPVPEPASLGLLGVGALGLLARRRRT